MSNFHDPAGVRSAPFMAFLGATRTLKRGGLGEVSVEMRQELLNIHHVAHGGVILALLDSALANAAMSRVDFQQEVVTVNMSTAFMRPAAARTLTAHARATGGGRSVCFCEGTVVDEAGQVLASALATFKYRQRSAGTPDPHAGAREST